MVLFRKLVLTSVLLISIFHFSEAQRFYETQWTSSGITYTGLLIYYDDDDATMRIKYTYNDDYKVAEFKCYGEFYDAGGHYGYLLNGKDAKIVYGPTTTGYSADNFYFEKGLSDYQAPIHIDDNGLLSDNPKEKEIKVDYWKELSTEVFTPQYVKNYFEPEEPLYRTLIAYNQGFTTNSSTYNHKITHLSYGNDQWFVTMATNQRYNSQSWKTGTVFPKDEISRGWDDDQYITSVAYGKEGWAVTMSGGTSYTTQMWRTRENFPNEEIKKGWEDDYDITELTYGNGVWALVMSKGSGYSSQEWSTREEFPSDVIKENWDEGKRITHLTYGEDRWAVVMAKDTGFGKQIWKTRTEFPDDEIKEGWDEGLDITSLQYGNGMWALVMSKTTEQSQSWKTSSVFPKEWILSKWNGTEEVINNTPEVIADAKLHVVMVANTLVTDIGGSCTVDKDNVVRQFDVIAAELDIEIEKTIIDGTNFNKDYVRQQLSNLNPSSNDIVVFMYSGHGYRWSDQSSDYPQLDLRYSNYQSVSESTSYNLATIYNTIKNKGARLNIVIGDCCNSDIGVTSRDGEFSLASRNYNTQGKIERLKKLFLESEGNLIVAAAKPNQTSCGNSRDGGYYISSFFSSLTKETSQLETGNPSWKNLIDRSLESAFYKTQNLRGCTPQNGIYYSSIKDQ